MNKGVGMVPDFSSAYGEFIDAAGKLSPPVTFAPLGGLMWSADPDGLLMSVFVPDTDGNACLLSALFPMTVGEASLKFRKKRFPAKTGDAVTVIQKIDEVAGSSGEVYSRFRVSVQTLDLESASQE